jgi:hypothetical protein
MIFQDMMANHRWEDNIKMELKRNGMCGCVLSSNGSRLALVAGFYECSHTYSGFIKGGEFLECFSTTHPLNKHI